MTLKINRAPLQSNIKLCASFHHHKWILTGVTVRKRLSWVMTFVTLTFDLWPWPFAWPSLLSLVMTPEHLVMIRWWEHSQKGVTDGQTDRRTEPFIELLGRSWKLDKHLLIGYEVLSSLFRRRNGESQEERDLLKCGQIITWIKLIWKIKNNFFIKKITRKCLTMCCSKYYLTNASQNLRLVR